MIPPVSIGPIGGPGSSSTRQGGVDVLKTLFTLSWKGLELPCSDFSYEKVKRLTRHSVSYLSGQLIRNLGSDSEALTYTIPLYQNMFNQRWGNAFTDIFPQLLALFNEETPGPLVDPVHGERQAYCVQIGYSITAQNRGGVPVQISFVSDTELDAEVDATPLTINAAKVAAEEYQRQYEAIVPEQERLTGESPLDILNAPYVFASKANQKVNKAAATLNRFANKIDSTRAEIETFRNIRDWPVIAAAKNLSRAARDATLSASHVSIRKKIRQRTVLAETSLPVLAAQLGISQDALLERNPNLAGETSVKAGTVVFFEEK
jgi:hypothetical protein